MADFTSAITAALTGGLNGMQAADKDNLLRTKAKLDAAKAARESSKSDVEMAEKGFKLNADTNKYEIDPDFYTAPPAALPGQPAAPGNPSYLRAQRVADLDRAKKAGSVQNFLSLRAVHAIRNPGKPLPPELEQYGEVPYDPKYDNLLTQGQPKPNDQLVGPELERATEKKLGLPEGSLAGKLTAGKAVGSAAYVTGQAGAAERAAGSQAAADARTDKLIGSHEGIAAANLKEREARALENAPENKRFAEKYTDYVSGDRDAALGVIRDLEESRDQLRARGDGAWQSYLPGAVPMFDKGLEGIKTNINNAASTGLKERFGSRPTNLDLQNALRFSYNPALSETQNADLLDKRIRTAKEKLSSRDQWASAYQKNKGNMKGYQGVGGGEPGDFGEEDLGPDTGSPTANPSALRAKAAQSGGAAVNGNIIPGSKIAALQAMPTKGTANEPKDGAVMKSPKDGKLYRRQGGRWFPAGGG